MNSYDFIFCYLVILLYSLFLMNVVCSLYPKRDLRGERLASTFWLKQREVPRFAKVISYLFDLSIIDPKGKIKFRKFIGSLLKMWKLSGITHTISYYTEVLRLVVCYVDYHNKFHPNTKTWVKTHRGRRSDLQSFAGLPVILPHSVKLLCTRVRVGISRGSLNRGDRLLFKLVLSFLSFFRATSPRFSEAKFSTITAPFGGVCETLDSRVLGEALRSLERSAGRRLVFRHKPSIFMFTTKAGPNAPLAILGIGLDLVAWILTPNKYISYCLMCLSRGYYMLLTVFVVSSLLILPLVVLYGFIEKPILGRIAVLEEARGKRRLIGITDWWTQVLLKPLHDDIYSFLGNLPQDGTNDQLRPIKLLLDSLNVSCVSKTGKRLQSIDLSAATDRLPVALQAQILGVLGFPGVLWRDLLERDWVSVNGLLRYSVGQPMGAYSSFAMLALTHHVIVRYAAIQAKINPDSVLYAVLGDDGAMANAKVAKFYKKLFIYLGMDINPIKGFDGSVLEFAKQLWTINGYNLSPLGAKNIMLFIRKVEFLPSLLYEILVKEFPLFHRRRRVLGYSVPSYPWVKKNGSIRVIGRNGRPVKHMAVGFLNPDRLVQMIMSLFYLKTTFDKASKKFLPVVLGRDVFRLHMIKSRLITLMSIGPRSGLWYLSSSSYSHIFDNPNVEGCFEMRSYFRLLFQKLLVFNWSFVKRDFRPDLWLASDLEYRQRILEDLRRDLKKLMSKLMVSIRIPLTFIPDFRGDSDRIVQWANPMFWYTTLSTPILANLLFAISKDMVKIFQRALLLLRFRVLSDLEYYCFHGFRWESGLLSVASFFVLDWPFLLCFLGFLAALHWTVTNHSVRDMVWSRINEITGRFTPGQGWPAYDPLSSSVSTLEKVADKIKLEDSSAWREMLRMTRSSKDVKDLEKDRLNLLKEEERRKSLLVTIPSQAKASLKERPVSASWDPFMEYPHVVYVTMRFFSSVCLWAFRLLCIAVFIFCWWILLSS